MFHHSIQSYVILTLGFPDVLDENPIIFMCMQVHFIVAACENMISGTGMRPGDIITASNGKTIEVFPVNLLYTCFTTITSLLLELKLIYQ